MNTVTLEHLSFVIPLPKRFPRSVTVRVTVRGAVSVIVRVILRVILRFTVRVTVKMVSKALKSAHNAKFTSDTDPVHGLRRQVMPYQWPFNAV